MSDVKKRGFAVKVGDGGKEMIRVWEGKAERQGSKPSGVETVTHPEEMLELRV